MNLRSIVVAPQFIDALPPAAEIYRDALFWMPLLARTMGTRENEVCDALVGDIKLEETNDGPIWYLEIIDGKDSGSERNVPFADLVLGMGFLEQRVIGRDPIRALVSRTDPAGARKAPVRGLYRPLRVLQAEDQDSSALAWIFIRFAATLKLISKTCPRPIRHGSTNSSAMNRPFAVPKESVTRSKFSCRYCSAW